MSPPSSKHSELIPGMTPECKLRLVCPRHQISRVAHRPLYQTQSSQWRALSSNTPALPGTAFSYISRAFRQTTPSIVGALRLLAASHSPQELNEVGYGLYTEFRPAVEGWGKRGEVRCETILKLRKTTKTEGAGGGSEPTHVVKYENVDGDVREGGTITSDGADLGS